MKYSVGDLVMAAVHNEVEYSHQGKLGAIIATGEQSDDGPIYEVMFHGCNCKELKGHTFKQSCGWWDEWVLLPGKVILSMSRNSSNNRWRNLLALQDR
jgi:hypothetical protein